MLVHLLPKLHKFSLAGWSNGYGVYNSLNMQTVLEDHFFKCYDYLLATSILPYTVHYKVSLC